MNLANLSLAGDGTPVVTAARERKRRICGCPPGTHCECERYYSQPDSFIGYDSSRELYYCGYNLYLLTAADSRSDLPIFPMLFPASRHDSLAFVETFAYFRSFVGSRAKVSQLLLDSAHDAMPIYQFCHRLGIQPFIDLNPRHTAKPDENVSLDTDGTPICKAGLRMYRDGCEKKRARVKFRCPLIRRGKDGKKFCACENPCTDSPYGPVRHIPTQENPRLYTTPARQSDAWKKEYKKRTSAERDNKRIKNDLHLESGRHRSTKLWYFRLYLTLMLLHLLAWPVL